MSQTPPPSKPPRLKEEGRAGGSLSASAIAGGVRSGETSAEEIVRGRLDAVKEGDSTIKAFLAVFEDGAMESARAVDRKRREGGRLGRLAGVPVALKDNMLVKGTITTCGSRILENYRSPYDATVVDLLKSEDAVIIGKTNLDEFAMGSSTENSAFFPTQNPWAPGHVPGGSSGGSAAAVAAGFAPVSLGSDTGGSIRQPAALCGIVGLKPTYGLVSRYGLVAFASSLDQIGPFSRTVEDSALLLDVIAAKDPRDSTSKAAPRGGYAEGLDAGVKGLRIGLPRQYFEAQGSDPEVVANVQEAIRALEAAGAVVAEASLPHTDYAVSTYYLIAPAEASSNLARFDGVRYGFSEKTAPDLASLYEESRGAGFGAEVKRRIMLGTYALSAGYHDAYYEKANRVRTLIRRDFEEAFESFDLLAAPTSPVPAFPMGERMKDPLSMYLADILTIPANLAGIPGISVPSGLTSKGLPVGLQLLAPAFAEKTLLRAAFALESARPFPRLGSND